MAINDTPWCGNSAPQKLYLQSGQFTSTLKTSEDVSTIETQPAGISWDATNTPWIGFTDDKLYLTSGQFTSTLKTSETVSGVDTVPRGVSWDGTNTPWCGSTDDKLYLTSGQFTSTIKTSQYVGGIDDIPIGISYDGTNTPWCGFTDGKLYLTSGQFTSTIKTSQSTSGVDNIIQDASWDGTNTPWCGQEGSKLYLTSGQFTSTIKTSELVSSIDSVPTGIDTNDVNARLGIIDETIVTPSTLTITVSILTPVIFTGEIITPSALSITASVLTPVIIIDTQILPSTLNITANILAPTVIIDVQISPSILTISASILTPVITIASVLNFHSLWSDERICLFVNNGELERLFPDYTVSILRSNVGNYPMSYTYAPNSPDKTEDTTYYSNAHVIGYINAQGIDNSFSDPGIALRTAPTPAQHIEYYNTRLYFGDNQTIWYSDALGLGRINKRLNNIPLSDEITMMEAVDDGIWVSTGDQYGRIFFLAGNTPQEFTEITKTNYGVIQGSAVKVRDAGSIFPDIGITGTAVIFATKRGICVGGNGGRFINLTYSRYGLIDNRFGAGLLRIIDNKAHYIMTGWS